MSYAGAGTSFAGQWGAGAEPDPSPNPLLLRPSLRWLLDFYWQSSFPLELDVDDLDAPPHRVSTIDLHVADFDGALYEGRVLEPPDIRLSAPDVFGGLVALDEIRVRLAATVAHRGTFEEGAGAVSLYPDLHEWVSREHRGKLVIGHLYDEETGELTEDFFRGEIIAMVDDLASVSVLIRPYDSTGYTEPLPDTEVTAERFPHARPTDYGRNIPLGTGIGRSIPCPNLKAQQADADDTEQRRTFTADDATDTITTATTHTYETGDLVRLETTDTLPAPLDEDQDELAGEEKTSVLDYYAVVVSDTELQLARTPAEADEAEVIDITDTGTGTHTLVSGRAANLDPHWDFGVGMGNVGVIRLREAGEVIGAGDTAVSDLLDPFQVLHRTYMLHGRYVTVVRFLTADVADSEITADVIRCYPDLAPETVAEHKYLRGLMDDVGGHHATGVSTAQLVQTRARWGLGAVRLDASDVLFLGDGGPHWQPQDVTWFLAFTPRPSATNGVAWRTNQTFVGMFVGRNVGGTLTVSVDMATDADVSYESPDPIPLGRPVHVVIRRDLVAGMVSIFVDGARVLHEARTGDIYYEPTTRPRWNGLDVDVLYDRCDATALGDDAIRAAYWLHRRATGQWLREVATAAGVDVVDDAMDDATVAIDAVQDGALTADGWITEPTDLRSVLAALQPVRDLTYALDAARRLIVTADTMPEAIAASFGVGDQYANLLAPPTRTRASLSEAVRRLVVAYRQNRGADGALLTNGYQGRITRDAATIGQAEARLELPFTDSALAADIIADFRAKGLVTADWAIDVQVGHEGRHLRPGDVVNLHLPAMGIPVLAVRITALAHGAYRATFRGVPFAVGRYDYTPKRLPPETVPPALTVLDVGTPTLTVEVDGDGNVLVQPVVAAVTELAPDRPVTQQWGTVTGGGTHVDVLADDSDATYLTGTPGQIDGFQFAAFPGAHPIVSVQVRLRLAKVAANATPSLRTLTDAGFTSTLLAPVTSASLGDITGPVWAGDPMAGTTWTPATLRALIVDLAPHDAPLVWSRLRLAVTTRAVELPGLARVDYWLVADGAAAPDEALDLPTLSLPDLTEARLPFPGSGNHDLYAALRDRWGRLVGGLIGPVDVTVP